MKKVGIRDTPEHRFVCGTIIPKRSCVPLFPLFWVSAQLALTRNVLRNLFHPKNVNSIPQIHRFLLTSSHHRFPTTQNHPHLSGPYLP